MYKIIKYDVGSDKDTRIGGGVAFIEYQASNILALECVSRSIEIKYPIHSVEIIGFCKTLEIDKLKCITEYDVFDNKEFIFKSFKLPYPVYHNGEDCL